MFENRVAMPVGFEVRQPAAADDLDALIDGEPGCCAPNPFRSSPSSHEARSTRMKSRSRMDDLQVVRITTVDQVQPSGELRLAPTGLDPWIVSSFSKQASFFAAEMVLKSGAFRNNLSCK
jgi:hypothetical protein